MISKERLLKDFKEHRDRITGNTPSEIAAREMIQIFIDKVNAMQTEEKSERNKYIANISVLMKHQESKGLATYGQLLQDNTEMTVIDRIEYLEEELVDALMYMEHLKEVATDTNVGNKWIPVSERLPENEEEVEISCVRRYIGAGDEKKMYRITARAFYSDGTLTTENSSFSWDEIDNWEYNEKKDAYIIPEGWWEYVTFSEEFGVVDAEVIAWRPLSEPYKGE